MEPTLCSTRERVTESIRDRLNKLNPISPENCISRVPLRLRIPSPQAFTARLISIGPLHFHDPNLKSMEDLKLRFLKSFFSRTEKPLAIIDFVVREERAIRVHYESEVVLDSKELSEMILLDSIFILELLLRNQEEVRDPLFDKRWLCRDLMHDLIFLIENQIPMFIPRKIYNEFLPSRVKSFQDLVYDYIKEAGNVPEFTFQAEPKHFIEYLRMSHMPKTEILPRPAKEESSVSSAARLVEIGVKLLPSSGSSLMEILFENGVLMIPRLTVNEWTSTYLHNLVAFEQWQGNFPRCFTDYVIVMNNVLQTPKDVQVLVDEGIIGDSTDDIANICNMFKEIYKDLPTKGRPFYFAQVCEKLKEYSSTRK